MHLLFTGPHGVSMASEYQTIEGEIQLWNGWAPWVRIESKDGKHVYGIKTNDEVDKSQFMPESLLKELLKNGSFIGSFCIELVGEQATVPYDDRVIEYIRVVSYEKGAKE